ncbi:tripeptidyl-peptidase I [Blastomyces parvus]|uniref:tripeptidyl-peptidase II n=1 Tax=Blastomyces parvus TaxID=2060905 RepID=A0A2B7X7F9_9EURO|nr:tripeptidyl-peptidase I [Blastomyces parvus]
MLTLLLSPLGLLLIGLVASVHPSRSSSFQVIEQLTSVPNGWIQGPAPDKDTFLRFRLAVHPEKEAIFHQKVVDISTPGHPLYGSHMRRDEVKDFLRPRSEVSAQLLFWLTSGGISSDKIKDDGAWIRFDATVGQAEQLLNTRFYSFIDEQTKAPIIRALEYSVPVSVAPHVRMIQPTTGFTRPQPHGSTLFRVTTPSSGRATEDGEVNYSQQITPSYLCTLYNIPCSKEPQCILSKVGVSGYLEQYAQYADLQLFLSAYVPDAPEANFSVQSINGGLNIQRPSVDSIEANLDIQYVLGLTPASNVTYYTTGGRGKLIPDLDAPDPAQNSNEPYLEQLHFLLDLADEDLPDVLTTSYGENEQSVPAHYAESTCSLFAELGARGVSVIFSSGDSGVGSSCKSNDGTNRTAFTPIFPGACPFVTSVGATTGINPERAVAFSSGGFSERFDRPYYQETAVQAYLNKLGNRWAGLYNPTGRAFPDIAAQGMSYSVVNKGKLITVDGTSASAPTVAAVISHLNALRLSQHKPVLGFLNPWIYSTGFEGFTDIVDGSSTGCAGTEIAPGVRTGYVQYASWNATEGWDPVTGFGTPNFSKLVELLPKDGGRGGGSTLTEWTNVGRD